MNKFVCFLGCILSLLCSSAQEGFTLTLLVTNPQQQPLQGATIMLYRLPDSALLKVQVTGVDGKAGFERLLPGDYFGRVTHTGYVNVTTTVLRVIGNEHQLAPVVLQATTGEMAGVTITARKPFIELKPGRTVVNVDAGITNAGTTVMEALEKMPGITADRDGNLSLKGKNGVLVLIDGKQTYLDPAQLATLLGGMNASQVAQVEIMDQPPAGFDAAGNAGIINIKLKKNQQKGLNGSITTAYGQGFYPKNNNSLQLNYRSGKWNLFGSYSLNNNTQFSRIYALRTYFKQDGTPLSLLEQPSFLKGDVLSHNMRAGADFAISTKTSVGFTLSGLSLKRHGGSTNEAIWMNPSRSVDSLILTIGSSKNRWQNAGASLSFRHSFSAGQEISADVDLFGYRMQGDQAFENRLLSPGGYSEAVRSSIPAELDILSAKTDYTRQWKSARFETGLKMSHITTDNLANFETREGLTWKTDFGRSNHFLYTENISAVYASAETKPGRWSLQAGLRFEATAYEANQLGNAVQKDSSFSRRYSNLFPTLLTSFEADSNHSFSFTAGRRIDRPAFQKLNPFVYIINKYTVQTGNPFYRPQYSWNMELSHVYKNRFITAVGYSVTTDFFSQIFPVESNGLVIYTEGNLGRLQQLTLSLSAQLSPTSWWSLSSQAVGTYKTMDGVVGRRLQASITQATVNMNNQFRFKKGWSGEVSGFYNSRSQNDIQEIVDPAGQFSVGLAKAIWKGKGTVKLAVRDIFYTQWMKGNTFFPGATEYFKLTRDTRVAQLSFSYRFGKTFKASKRSEGAAGDEIRRVGNG